MDILAQLIDNSTPVTNCIFAMWVLCSVAVYAMSIPSFVLVYSTAAWTRLELWRLLTAFLHFGRTDIDILVHVILFSRYSKGLEQYVDNTADYVYMLLVNGGFVLLAATMFDLKVLGPVFSTAIVYLWSRTHSNSHINFMSFVSFPAIYMPFVTCLISFVIERKLPVTDLIGIVCGHLYYHLRFFLPSRSCADVLQTPAWLKRLLPCRRIRT